MTSSILQHILLSPCAHTVQCVACSWIFHGDGLYSLLYDKNLAIANAQIELRLRREMTSLHVEMCETSVWSTITIPRILMSWLAMWMPAVASLVMERCACLVGMEGNVNFSMKPCNDKWKWWRDSHCLSFISPAWVIVLSNNYALHNGHIGVTVACKEKKNHISSFYSVTFQHVLLIFFFVFVFALKAKGFKIIYWTKCR